MQHTLSQQQPRITIGVPTYNGGNYLRGCLINILEQTYQDYVVVISDNASTDDTARIANEFVVKDRRFSYLRQPTFVDGVPHLCSLLDHAKTPFFIWHSDDDLWAPNYLETLLALLDSNPDAKLAVGDSVDEYMDGSHRKETKKYRQFGLGILQRMQALLYFPAPWIYGLYERETITALAKTVRERHQLTRGWDLLVLFYYCINNLVVGSSETHFIWRCYIDQNLQRQHAGKFIDANPQSQSRMSTWVVKLKKKIAKVDYLIEARKRFFTIALEWIPSLSKNKAEEMLWRAFLWHFVARRIYPARKALKYKVMAALANSTYF